MFVNGIGANDFTIEELEKYLDDEGEATPTSNNEGTPQGTPPANQSETQPTETQVFAKRLKEATTKARDEERESIAKSLGYGTYAELQKARETNMLEEKGLDPEAVAPVVEELVKKRLAEDPRMQELEAIRQQRAKEWADKELAELKELTGGKIQKLDDVPKDVIELWKTKGSLKAAYLDLNGEKLIREMQTGIASAQSRGTTAHLNEPTGNPNPPSMSGKRLYTEQEKEIYRFFNPGVTDEQLNKLTKNT